MVGGGQAARWVRRAGDTRNYSGAFLQGFERDVMRCLKAELRLSPHLQRLTNRPGLLNFVVRKAVRSAEPAGVLSRMFDDESQRRLLAG